MQYVQSSFVHIVFLMQTKSTCLFQLNLQIHPPWNLALVVSFKTRLVCRCWKKSHKELEETITKFSQESGQSELVRTVFICLLSHYHTTIYYHSIIHYYTTIYNYTTYHHITIISLYYPLLLYHYTISYYQIIILLIIITLSYYHLSSHYYTTTYYPIIIQQIIITLLFQHIKSLINWFIKGCIYDLFSHIWPLTTKLTDISQIWKPFSGE